MRSQTQMFAKFSPLINLEISSDLLSTYKEVKLLYFRQAMGFASDWTLLYHEIAKRNTETPKWRNETPKQLMIFFSNQETHKIDS